MAREAAEAASVKPGYWLYVAHLAMVWGLALSNAFLGLAGLWSALFWRRLRGMWSRSFRIVAPLGCYAVLLGVSILTSKNPATSAPEIREVLSLTTLPLALLLVRGERATRRVVEIVIGVTAVLGAVGIVQFLLTDYGPIANRIRGPFSHYMTFSGVMMVGGFLVLSQILTRSGRRRPLDWVMLVTIGVAILLTLTRGVWIATAVTGVFALVSFTPKSLKLYLGGGAAALLLIFLAIPGPWVARMRSLVDPRDVSTYDRLCMAEAGFTMIKERPLFGIGPRLVEELYPIYRNPTAPRRTVGHLHNTFIDHAAERGLLSLAAYLWLMVLAGQTALRGYRYGRAPDLHLGVLLAIVAFNIGGLFEANWRDTEVQRLMLFLLAVPFILELGDGRAGSAGMLDEAPDEASRDEPADAPTADV